MSRLTVQMRPLLHFVPFLACFVLEPGPLLPESGLLQHYFGQQQLLPVQKLLEFAHVEDRRQPLLNQLE